MQFFDRISIRYKLAVLLALSLGLGLCVSCAVALYSTFAAERQSSLRALHRRVGLAEAGAPVLPPAATAP